MLRSTYVEAEESRHAAYLRPAYFLLAKQLTGRANAVAVDE